MSGGGRWFDRVGAPLLIAATAVAFWYVCLIAPAWQRPFAATLGNIDFFAYMYPVAFRAAAWIRDGVFPLWNPYQGAGHPVLATALMGLFYPPNVLYLV